MKTKMIRLSAILLCLSLFAAVSFAHSKTVKAAPAVNTTAAYDSYEEYEYTPTHSPIWIVIAIGVGLMVAAISGASERSSMKSVRQQTQARNYVRSDSLNMLDNSEMFLYKRTERIPIQQQQPMQGAPLPTGQQQGMRQAYQQPHGTGHGAGYGNQIGGSRGAMTNASIRPAVQPTTMHKVAPRSEVPNRTQTTSGTANRQTTAVQRPQPVQRPQSVQSRPSQSVQKTVNNRTTGNFSANRTTVSRPSSSVSGNRSTVSRPTSSGSRPSTPASRPSASRPTGGRPTGSPRRPK